MYNMVKVPPIIPDTGLILTVQTNPILESQDLRSLSLPHSP